MALLPPLASRLPQIRVMVTNYAGINFLAQAYESITERLLRWRCPVCGEADIAWVDPDVSLWAVRRNMLDSIEQWADCPVCGCDVNVSLF